MTTSLATISIATGTYRVDPATSSIAFTAKHMWGMGTVAGSFSRVTGDIEVGDDPRLTRVSAAAPVDRFDTANAKRDDKVRSPQFLDAANHPQVAFRSSAVTETPDGLVVDGELTVVGESAPVRLLVTELTPRGNDLSVTATATVDRYAHGLTAMKGMVGRRLDLVLTVQATRD